MTRFLPLLFLFSSIALLFSQEVHAAKKPKLVIMLSIDQLRGDMPWRFEERLGKRGLRYFMDEGVAYSQAYYRHATTFTAVGHATIATGGNSAQHGLVANDWFDPIARKSVYCTQDTRHKILGKKTKANAGTSPKNLLSSTFGDELTTATGGRSRVFGVSIKDRGAILLAGHSGKAFWYSGSDGTFVTSDYYYQDYPTWVKQWNDLRLADRYGNTQWTLLHDLESYVYGRHDDRPFERSYKSLGRTFPHSLACDKPADLYSTIRFTPMGDELTIDFASTLLKQEQLGQRGATDVLAVSLSCTDYIGHAFGPNSLEAEDNFLRVDKLLEKFFTTLDEHVGLDSVLIVLSADHGVNSAPEHIASRGVSAGRHNMGQIVAKVNRTLGEKYSTERALIARFYNPCFYLNRSAMKDLKLDREEVERAIAEEVLKIEGFAYAVTHTDLRQGRVASDPILDRIQRAFHPGRSGCVFVVPDRGWYLYGQTNAYTAMHGTPYRFDTYVPVMFAGPGVRPQRVLREIGPEDIAPTLSSYFGITPPSGSTGTPLGEVLSK